MDTALGLVIMGEVFFTLFVIWGIAHEDRFVSFENKVLSKLKMKRKKYALRLIIGGNSKSGEDAA